MKFIPMKKNDLVMIKLIKSKFAEIGEPFNNHYISSSNSLRSIYKFLTSNEIDLTNLHKNELGGYWFVLGKLSLGNYEYYMNSLLHNFLPALNELIKFYNIQEVHTTRLIFVYNSTKISPLNWLKYILYDNVEQFENHILSNTTCELLDSVLFMRLSRELGYDNKDLIRLIGRTYQKYHNYPQYSDVLGKLYFVKRKEWEG